MKDHELVKEDEEDDDETMESENQDDGEEGLSPSNS